MAPNAIYSLLSRIPRPHTGCNRIGSNLPGLPRILPATCPIHLPGQKRERERDGPDFPVVSSGTHSHKYEARDLLRALSDGKSEEIIPGLWTLQPAGEERLRDVWLGVLQGLSIVKIHMIKKVHRKKEKKKEEEQDPDR